MGDASTGQNQMVTVDIDAQQKRLQRAIYFYRTGDLTAWNYTILALSFLGLFLGLFLLSKNILNNRKRKMIAMYKMNMAVNKEEEPDGKHAVLVLEKENLQEDSTLKRQSQPGDIKVQWQDGQTSALYTDAPEADV